ncbi:glutamate racemase [Aestuariibacter halophilus]|uniref:Glutamate racemase n=1 Tax=Fluctibacter halophilus TaxID=226011 RepID=A0ABS8GC17_9ALTE|nr:glutamate racemase [Aestuariibacter halophilus]MCC2618110.1 glutamate racemase [Aestuariibacter halophilus]
MSQQPVGVFDSGVGGLSITTRLHQCLPRESLLYVADNAHAPYGEKTPQAILQRCQRVIDHLLAAGAKAVVVACNTATVSCIAQLREQYSIPIIGVEPGIKPALTASRSGKVGVLVTQRTSESERFLRLVNALAGDRSVWIQPCPGLVEHIEALNLGGSAVRECLSAWLTPMLAEGIDQLVLGCTHYALVTDVIRELTGPSVSIVDTGAAVARQTARRLKDAGLLNTTPRATTLTAYTSGDNGTLQTLVQQLGTFDDMTVCYQPLPD